MSERDSGYGKGLVAGILLGGAVGAIAALLLAPKSGKELRQDLAEKSGELLDKADSFLNEKEEYDGPYTPNEGRARAEKIVQSAKDHAEQLLSSAEQVLRDARMKAVNTKDNLVDGVSRVRDAARAGADAFRDEMNDVGSDY